MFHHFFPEYATVPVEDTSVSDLESALSLDSDTVYASRVFIKAHRGLKRAEGIEKSALCIGLIYVVCILWFVKFSFF